MTLDIKHFLGLLLVIGAVACVFVVLLSVPKEHGRNPAIFSLAFLAGVSLASILS